MSKYAYRITLEKDETPVTEGAWVFDIHVDPDTDTSEELLALDGFFRIAYIVCEMIGGDFEKFKEDCIQGLQNTLEEVADSQ